MRGEKLLVKLTLICLSLLDENQALRRNVFPSFEVNALRWLRPEIADAPHLIERECLITVRRSGQLHVGTAPARTARRAERELRIEARRLHGRHNLNRSTSQLTCAEGR